MTVLSLRLYALITAVIATIQIHYNASWIGQPAPPFYVPDWLIAVELAWALVSIDLAVRLRRRRLPFALPTSYALYTVGSVFYASWLAATSGTGTVTEAMIPLWWKLGAVAIGAWFLAGAIMLVARMRDAVEENSGEI